MNFLRTTSTRRLIAGSASPSPSSSAASPSRPRPSSGGSPPPPKPLDVAVHDALTAPKPDGHHRAHPLHEQPHRERRAEHRLAAADRRRRSPLGLGRTCCGSSCSPTPATRRSPSPTATSRSTTPRATRCTAPTRASPGSRRATPASDPRARRASRRSSSALSRSSPSRPPSRAPSRPRRPASRRTTVSITPKHDAGLLGQAELAWDAANGIPLRIAVDGRRQQLAGARARGHRHQLRRRRPRRARRHAAGLGQGRRPRLARARRPAGAGTPADAGAEPRSARPCPFTLSAPDSLVGLPRTGRAAGQRRDAADGARDLRQGPRRDRRDRALQHGGRRAAEPARRPAQP